MGEIVAPELTDPVLLQPLVRERQGNSEKAVFTNGVFDLIHPGHVQYLRAAKAYGNFLIVALNSDESVRRLKGSQRPILPLHERARIIGSLEMVDFVTFFEEDTPLEIITRLQPDVLVKGGDYTADTIVGSREVRKSGGEVHVLNFVEGNSSSNIIQRIIDSANRSLRG